MVKRKLANIEKEYVVNLLKVNEKFVGKEREVILVIANIAMACWAVSLSRNKLILGMVFLFINIGVLVSLVHFMKKVTFNVRNLCFYHGLYCVPWAITTSILSCIFYQKQFISQRTMIVVKVIFIIILFTLVYFIFLINKIANDGYRDYKHEEVTLGKMITGGFAVSAFFQNWSIYSKGGTLSLIATMAIIAVSMYYLVKAHCFSLVDENEIRTCLIKISKENATFNRYGTKKHKKF